MEDLVREVFTAIEAGDDATLRARLHPDCHVTAPGFEAQGPDPFLAWERSFMAAFPDLRHEIGVMAASNGVVAFELVVRGTHTAPLVTPNGEIPPTGRGIRLLVANVWQVDDDLITSYHIYFDSMAFLAQLGLTPEPAAG